jgi:hypothetical protein
MRPRKNRHRHPLQPLMHILIISQSQSLIIFTLGPRIHGPLEPLLHNVRKPGLFKIPLIVRGMSDNLPEFLGTGDHHVGILAERGSLIRVVNAPVFSVEVEHLEIAAGIERSVGFFEDRERVGKTHGQETAVDVVKFFFVEPVVLRIIDFEAAVGWDTISNFNKILHKGSRREMKMKHKLDGLNRTQIRSQNI